MKDYCRWTERSDDYDEICGEDADGGEIFMRTSTGSVTTPVCKRHKAVHNERAAAARRASKTKS
jgi:hypothetical protein